jgi:dihydroorotate dehydrogenase
MGIYHGIVFPILRQLDAERAHDAACAALALAQDWGLGRRILRALAGEVPSRTIHLWGLEFPNALGVAAGFDKDARVAAGLADLGFGHVEVGTLTPRPQPGNPRPRIFRLPRHKALINRMGFPNAGVQAALPRLAKAARRMRPSILGVSLGKQKATPLEEAVGDYAEVMRAVYPYADYLAINVSSPNTPGLRELQGKAYLSGLLSDLARERDGLARQLGALRRPLLVKIAPDLTDAELDQVLEAATGAGIDGVIATNTTVSRMAVDDDPLATEEGGLSGRPLAEPSTRMIARIAQVTQGALPIVGAGGIFSATDARAKLDAGASLVQLYTGFVYEGPRLPGRIARGLAK